MLKNPIKTAPAEYCLYLYTARSPIRKINSHRTVPMQHDEIKYYVRSILDHTIVCFAYWSVMPEAAPPYGPPFEPLKPSKPMARENGSNERQWDATNQANRRLCTRLGQHNQGAVRPMILTLSLTSISEDEEFIPLDDHNKDMLCVAKIEPTGPWGGLSVLQALLTAEDTEQESI